MIEIKIDDKELNAGLQKLIDLGQNMSPVMGKISAIMLSDVQENFKAQGRPEPWTPLAASTIQQRKKKGHWPGQILNIHGSRAGLLSSIQPDHNNNSAVVGSELVYAPIQHFGGMAGRGHKIKIPARPFLVITDEGIDKIENLIVAYLSKGLNQ